MTTPRGRPIPPQVEFWTSAQREVTGAMVRAAALVVCGRARDGADARLILDRLGILGLIAQQPPRQSRRGGSASP